MIEALFFTVFLGALIGKIGKGSFRLCAAGILLTAIPIGVLLGSSAEHSESIRQACGYFSSLGSSLFIAVIALRGGTELLWARGRRLKAFFAGACIALIGAAAAVACLLWDKSLNMPLILGLLSGAMTSTPALSAVYDLGVLGADATLGYGTSYCIGMMSIVLFVRLVRIRHSQSACVEYEPPQVQGRCAEALPLLSLVILLGTALGKLFYIGNTGGILMLGVLIGLAVSLKKVALPDMSGIKTLGMALFFASNGILAGIDLRTGFSIKYFLYGAFICCTAVLLGFLMLRSIFRFPDSDALSVLCGGMTSTPAIGALQSRKNDTDISLYFSSYIGALLALPTAVRIIFEIFSGRG